MTSKEEISSYYDDKINAVWVSEISRNFSPEFYNENGFQSPVAVTEGFAYLNKDQAVSVTHAIGSTEISYYDFPFFDTSAFSIYDLST